MGRTDLQLLDAHSDRERFPIFNLQFPIPNWVAIENWKYWKLKIDNWLGRFMESPGLRISDAHWGLEPNPISRSSRGHKALIFFPESDE